MKPAYWVIDDWRVSPAFVDLTLAEQGALRNILDAIWIRGGVIPNIERTLALSCGDPEAWPMVGPMVLAQLRPVPGGWAPALVRYRNGPPEMRRPDISSPVRRAVFERDEGRCTECGSDDRLEIDHIVRYRDGGGHEITNLRLLCRPCNRRRN